MPKLSLKEAIEILKGIRDEVYHMLEMWQGSPEDRKKQWNNQADALSLAISKLSLLEQVEKGGVKKGQQVKKLEGIRETIQNAILSYQVNEASISCQYLKDNPKSLIDCLAQAIITYLTKKEE